MGFIRTESVNGATPNRAVPCGLHLRGELCTWEVVRRNIHRHHMPPNNPPPLSSQLAPGDDALLESLDDGVVGRLGAEVAVEQQRVGAGAPRVRVADAPDGDADAGRHVQARLGDLRVVVGGRLLDVELGDGHLLDARGGEGLEGCAEAGGLSAAQMCLGSWGEQRSDPVYISMGIYDFLTHQCRQWERQLQATS